MAELVFLLGADIDIQRAYEFYEECQAGRGDVFMRHLDAAFAHVRRFPESAPIFRRDYRRLLVPRFPYGIFYTVEASRLVVAAVMYLRQDPKAIIQRLGEAQ